MEAFILQALSNPEFVVAVVTVFVTVLVPLVSRRRNRLIFDVVCEAMLIDTEDGDVDRNQKKVETREKSRKEIGPVLFIIDLRNPGWGVFGWLGGENIPSSHYEREISFSFGEGSRVLEADVVEEDPEGIGAEAYRPLPRANRLVVRPVLLNQGDSFRLRALVENPNVETYPRWLGHDSILFKSSGFFTTSVDGRILGIRAFQRKRGSQELLAYGVLADTLALLPIMLGSMIGLVSWGLTKDPMQLLAWVLWSPAPFTEPFTAVIGAQTALLFIGQVLLVQAIEKQMRARKVARQYSPPSSYPLPVG